MKLQSLPIKTQLIIFLSLFVLYLTFLQKDLLFLFKTLIAVAGAISAESLAVFFKQKKFALTESSAISGLIIGFVLSSISPWWMFLLASVFAIGSKYVLRIREKHLFNPAAFGIFLVTALLGAYTQWRGANLWYVLVPAGAYFVLKIRKIEVVLGYLAVFTLLSGVEAFFQNTPLWDVLLYQNYFFIFVMLIEPKTTPITRKGKVVFGVAAAILVFILTQCRVRFEAELLSLLAANILVYLLNKYKGYLWILR
ncbi:MAG: RnfABCDGE type electron transport complex subunit D [Candidatus Omnitrophica bacterium]|nr:RnfABCDGE type electron transport complex subunit D [Candidatus Omnitrophota bacterium]